MTTTIRPVSAMILIGLSETNTIGYICRQVQRQLMRNELVRLYHYRTRNCLPPRKLRRDIQ